jgi:dTDP-4-dehydrorhamnose reductase
MTAPDLRTETAHHPTAFGASPTRQLASALLHLLDRDEALPLRWRAAVFIAAVAGNRASLALTRSIVELDNLAPASTGTTFRGAVTALASDPLAAALAVRRLELVRGSSLPAWPTIVRHGVAPRVSHAEQGRWFG